MTKKTAIVRLPGSTLVGFEQKSTVRKGGNTLERVVYLDKTNNGLSVGDTMFSFYYATKPASIKECIFGCDNPLPRTEIRAHTLTARDVRRYRRSFKKRFVKLVRTAGAHRPDAKKIPKTKRAVCNAYWKIIGRRSTAMEAISPIGKKVRFSTPVTTSTQVNMQAFSKSSPRVPYDVQKPKPVNPALCRAISAKATISIAGKSQAVTISAGAGDYPIWLTLLFDTGLFKVKYHNYLAQVGVDYMFGGNRYIHLALTGAALVASRR